MREAAPEWAADAPDSAGAEADRLLELADEIVTLSAHIQAATARLLERLAEFDRLGGWRAEGHRSCAHGLAHHTNLAQKLSRSVWLGSTDGHGHLFALLVLTST